MKKFYITTSIAYTNASPHVGFALELVQADVLARRHGLRGDKRLFLTGTDEHGRKNAQAAKEKGLVPQVFVDEISAKFRDLAKLLNISNDDFIRTSDKTRHWPGVEKFWKLLSGTGDFYKGMYKGLYCDGCEAFKKPSDLVEGKCPDHQKEPTTIEEENWFFRLSKYQTELKRVVETNELRIIPEARKNEVLAFIDQGLEDVSFSRPSKDLSWGIPVPGDDTQTIYVWADALVNYLTGLGFGQDPEPGTRNLFDQFWPADVHVIGKDILRFHAVIWPAMLLSAKLPLPKALFVHGHILSGGQKMSKSLGSVIDPFAVIKQYGADALRYFLLKEIPTTGDGDFTLERFREVYNSDLAHTLGNLVSRVSKLAEGRSVRPSASGEVRKMASRAWIDYDLAFDAYQLNDALVAAMSLAHFANGFIDRMRPWALRPGAGQENGGSFENVLAQLIWLLGHTAWMLTPFLPETARKMFERLGIDPNDQIGWETKESQRERGDVLFPRV